MKLTHELKQVQQLSQLQIQGLSILSLGNQELFEYCISEQTENPTLELSDEVAQMYEVASYLKEAPSYHLFGSSGGQDEDATETELFEPEKLTLSEHLTSQLDHKRLTDEEILICKFLIECLTDKGYLEISPLEVTYLINKSLAIVARCIEEVQSLEPAGIAAFNLSSCLILQLQRQGNFDPLLEELVKYHLESLSQGYLNKVAKMVKREPSEIKTALSIIKNLNPRPANGYYGGVTQYVVPDIVFFDEEERGYRLNDNWTQSVRISHLYTSLEQYKDYPEAAIYLKDKINRSRALITAIDKRHNTLKGIASYLMEQQSSAIFEDTPPKPLSMSKLAAQLGISPSTITRAVSGKYYQCPKGTYLLRSLFVFGETEGDSEAVGREGVKKKLEEIIKNETTPLSDEKLAKLLGENGFEIKRRTVAKYREELGIPAAKGRGVGK